MSHGGNKIVEVDVPLGGGEVSHADLLRLAHGKVPERRGGEGVLHARNRASRKLGTFGCPGGCADSLRAILAPAPKKVIRVPLASMSLH
eukprot:5471740-Pyramimonas_sp.AAC.1